MPEETENLNTGIDGLTFLSVGEKVNRLSGSKFALPPQFPAHTHASRWVEDGPGVLEAKQFEYIPGANVKAKGWDVWLHDPEAGKVAETSTEEDALPPKRAKLKPYVRTIGKRNYVLMCRPKRLQQAVNKLYADESRRRTGQVISGEVNPVAGSDDPHGLVTDHQLNRYAGRERDEGENYMRPTAGSQPTRLHEADELQLQ